MEISLLFYLLLFLIVLFSSVYVYLRYVPKTNEVSCKDFNRLIDKCTTNAENFTNVFLIEECDGKKPRYYDIIYIDGGCITIPK